MTVGLDTFETLPSELKNSSPLIGLKHTTPRLHVGCSNRWASTFHFSLWNTDSGHVITFVCIGEHTKFQSCPGNSTHFRLCTVVLDKTETLCRWQLHTFEGTRNHDLRPVIYIHTDQFISKKLTNSTILIWKKNKSTFATSYFCLLTVLCFQDPNIKFGSCSGLSTHRVMAAYQNICIISLCTTQKSTQIIYRFVWINIKNIVKVGK